MIVFNELVIDGVRTSSFPFKIIIKEYPSFELSESKSRLWEHDGINGAIMQSNKHRPPIHKRYTIQMVKPTEEQLNHFMALLVRERFWLENEQVKTTKLWCYKVESTEARKINREVYVCEATFICHPTKFFKQSDSQTLTSSGVLRVQGSALAFPKIKVTGHNHSETSFTVGGQVIRLEKLLEPVVMVNNPESPSFLNERGQLIRWAGDFITVDPSLGKTVGVVLGAGIQSLEFETFWGWA